MVIDRSVDQRTGKFNGSAFLPSLTFERKIPSCIVPTLPTREVWPQLTYALHRGRLPLPASSEHERKLFGSKHVSRCIAAGKPGAKSVKKNSRFEHDGENSSINRVRSIFFRFPFHKQTVKLSQAGIQLPLLLCHLPDRCNNSGPAPCASAHSVEFNRGVGHALASVSSFKA